MMSIILIILCLLLRLLLQSYDAHYYNHIEEYTDMYPNLPRNKNTYLLNEKEYKREQIFEADFVIYPWMTNDSESNRSNVREIIKVLLELFPDEINIASNKYPRFNFKINNCIYIGFGEGIDKQKVGDGTRFTEPLEYKTIQCEAKEKDECLGLNHMSKYASATQLCTYDDDKQQCMINPIMSKHKLVFIQTPEELVVDGKQLNSIANIYEFVDQPIPHLQ